MVFDAKGPSKLDVAQQVLLTEMRPIVYNDDPLLLELKKQYELIDSKSNSYERAYCSVLASILFQKRIYFAITRASLRHLMVTDVNIPEGLRGISFSHSTYPAILAKFYNQYKILELVLEGDRYHASIYKVTHPEILSYLQGIVNEQEQYEQALHFNKTKI